MNAPIHRFHSAGRPARDRRAASTLWCHTIGCLLTLVLGLLVAPCTPEAQPRGHIPVVGMLRPGDPAADAAPKSYLNAFRQGLRELGYVEGQTIRLEVRYAAWQWDRLPSLAAELVQRNPDVLVTATTPGALAAQQATTTIPIVVAVSEDLVAEGIVASLARPGGNITGQNLSLRGTHSRTTACKRPRGRKSKVQLLPTRTASWDSPSSGSRGFTTFASVLRTSQSTLPLRN